MKCPKCNNVFEDDKDNCPKCGFIQDDGIPNSPKIFTFGTFTDANPRSAAPREIFVYLTAFKGIVTTLGYRKVFWIVLAIITVFIIMIVISSLFA